MKTYLHGWNFVRQEKTTKVRNSNKELCGFPSLFIVPGGEPLAAVHLVVVDPVGAPPPMGGLDRRVPHPAVHPVWFQGPPSTLKPREFQGPVTEGISPCSLSPSSAAK